MKSMWNERYSSEEYIYGTKPNKFFAEQISKLEPGKVLFLGEGEGRNAMHAAKLGWDVDAVDYSEAGKLKALKLAEQENVNLNYMVGDVTKFDFEENNFDAAVIIYLHLNEKDRNKVHKNVIDILKPNGKIILEVFEKSQIKNDTGGPKNIDLLYSLEDIFEDFQDLDIIKFSNETIHLNEGDLHNGTASVIQYVGEKKH
ncbi:MAG: class I SAM-dependent methyltransferase [Ignavibacteriae bacterium]|nr:class I SAM-dependent methyltransferase [Ignavibacteriota bacterium]NOG99686.1 class I SAM-dependent methyltransferase [Ignavibacteriota bacterium]